MFHRCLDYWVWLLEIMFCFVSGKKNDSQLLLKIFVSLSVPNWTYLFFVSRMCNIHLLNFLALYFYLFLFFLYFYLILHMQSFSLWVQFFFSIINYTPLQENAYLTPPWMPLHGNPPVLGVPWMPLDQHTSSPPPNPSLTFRPCIIHRHCSPPPLRIWLW